MRGKHLIDRAAELLKRDDVRSRGTPAVRIAFDLKMAKSCSDQAALIEHDPKTFAASPWSAGG